MKIIVGTWGATGNHGGGDERLRSSGADEVVVSLAEAVVQLAKCSVTITHEMIPAPIPANEEERLSELKELQILDTVPEDAFDRITAKVARIFEVPIALVSFIDRDRQWFKSATGLPPDLSEAGSTSRAASVCGHVVASDEPLTVEDIHAIVVLRIIPSSASEGYDFTPAFCYCTSMTVPISSLCILDTKPRRLSEREQRLLEVLADDVVDEIKRRARRSAAAVAA